MSEVYSIVIQNRLDLFSDLWQHGGYFNERFIVYISLRSTAFALILPVLLRYVFFRKSTLSANLKWFGLFGVVLSLAEFLTQYLTTSGMDFTLAHWLSDPVSALASGCAVSISCRRGSTLSRRAQTLIEAAIIGGIFFNVAIYLIGSLLSWEFLPFAYTEVAQIVLMFAVPTAAVVLLVASQFSMGRLPFLIVIESFASALLLQFFAFDTPAALMFIAPAIAALDICLRGLEKTHISSKERVAYHIVFSSLIFCLMSRSAIGGMRGMSSLGGPGLLVGLAFGVICGISANWAPFHRAIAVGCLGGIISALVWAPVIGPAVFLASFVGSSRRFSGCHRYLVAFVVAIVVEIVWPPPSRVLLPLLLSCVLGVSCIAIGTRRLVRIFSQRRGDGPYNADDAPSP